MQISSSLHSYRRAIPNDQPEETVINRRDDAITGSQTVLSSSLAEALWTIQRGIEDELPTSSAVENLYLSYSE
jgi:hypothetical protein